MNARLTAEQEALALVEVIGFKWLMAHEGHVVYVDRLQQDADYARVCLALADASPTPTLRAAAASLRAQLLMAPR